MLRLIACCLMLSACSSIPLLSPSPEEIRQDKYFVGIHRYPSQNLRQLGRQLEEYKARCGVDAELTAPPALESTSGREAAITAQTEDGIMVLMLLEQIDDNVVAHAWVRDTRLADYLSTALEGGACGPAR